MPSEIRNVKTLFVSGGARFFYQSAAPTTRYDTTAFDSDDLGSIWIDSDDNKMYILTATTPTWTSIESVTMATFLAAAREIAFADAALTLKNTDAEDTDGGRQSRLIVKGVQSGDEETTLGYIEISHEGSGDDQKGQLIVKLNDGDDNDAPSKQPIGYQSTGKIDVANSLSVLDEDNMASDDADVVATQQSIKAHVAAAIAAIAFGTWTDKDSGGSTALAKDEVYKVGSDGFVFALATGGADWIRIKTDGNSSPAATRFANSTSTGLAISAFSAIKKDDYFKVEVETTVSSIYWLPMGSGTCVKQ